MSMSWASLMARTRRYSLPTKLPSTNTSKRLASRSLTPTSFGVVVARLNRARFHRSRIANGASASDSIRNDKMKIAFLELHDWEEKYLRERMDHAHDLLAFREVLEDKHLA